MNHTFLIIDDDINIRTMLKELIHEQGLGKVFSEVASGKDAVNEILFFTPDVVIVDMLLPEKDGIQIVEEAIKEGYKGKFIMVSQVEDQRIVSKAYQAGIVFFINKPINAIEVKSVISHVTKSLEYERSMEVIQSTVSNFQGQKPQEPVVPLEKRIDRIFSDIGIINESGSKYLKTMIIEVIKQEQISGKREIVLKDLYKVAKQKSHTNDDINLRSLEQKIRRTVLKALSTIALIGVEDYYNIKFMDYSTILFDLKQVKQEMKYLENASPLRGKINIKKFIEGLCSKLK